MKLAERILRRKEYILTSPYGYRIHPISKKWTFHKGDDYFTLGEKWPQYALEDGKILGAGKDYLGNLALFVWIQYPRLGYDVLYYHCDSLLVKKNDLVNENTIASYTGRTGDSTGIHLHLQVRNSRTKKLIDPETIDYKPLSSYSDKGLDFNVGDKVKIMGSYYATGQKIPLWVKLRTHTVGRLNGSRILLKEIVSWVYDKDIKKEG